MRITHNASDLRQIYRVLQLNVRLRRQKSKSTHALASYQGILLDMHIHVGSII